MSRLEERLITRWSAQWFLIAGVVIVLAGVAPLGLYILFGDPRGNPIGLGLLAVAAVPVGSLAVVIGVVKRLVGLFVGRR